MRLYPIITAFKNALKKTEIDPSKICVVSDVLYDKEITDSLGIDLFHTTRGRAIAFGTGLKLGNLTLKVVVFMGDLATIGGNHFVHAGRRNMDMVVICMNNFIYKRLGGPRANPIFSLYANFEQPFNIPHLAKSCGAVYVARWTALHETELTTSIYEALQKQGFSVIEIISPGGNYFAGVPSLKEEFDLLKFYHKNSEIKNGEPTNNLDIVPQKKIIVGKFVDRKRPTFIDSYNAQLMKVMGDKFKPYGSE